MDNNLSMIIFQNQFLITDKARWLRKVNRNNMKPHVSEEVGIRGIWGAPQKDIQSRIRFLWSVIHIVVLN